MDHSLVHKRQTTLLAAIRYDAIITAEIPLPDSPNVQLDLLGKGGPAALCETGAMTAVSAEQFIRAVPKKHDSGLAHESVLDHPE